MRKYIQILILIAGVLAPVGIRAQSGCPPPTGVTVSDITYYGATISWTRGGAETLWELTIGNNRYYTADTFYTVGNLDGDNAYEARVRAICGAGDTSERALSALFYTQCAAIGALPYFNDFEEEPFYGGVGGSPGSTSAQNAFPNCWIRINDGTTSRYYPVVTDDEDYVIHGGRSMYFYHATYNNYAENEYAVLPPVNRDLYNNHISNLTMSFFARCTWNTAPFPIFIVGVMVNYTDTSTFVPVDTVTLSGIATLYTVSFANYTGSGKYIAIKCPRNGMSCHAMLDDVYLNLTSQWCNPPTNLTATATDSEVTLRWNANGNSSFTVMLGNTTVNGVTDTFYTFSNLHDSLMYNYAVAAECPSGSSVYLTGCIQTECHPLTYDDLPYLEDFERYGTASDSAISPCWHRGITGYYYNRYAAVLCRFETDGDTAGLSLGARNDGSYDYSGWVALPRLADTVDVSDLEINMLVRRPSSGAQPIPLSCMVVGVSSDITDDDSFVTVDTVDFTTYPVNSVHHVTVRFENYTGTGKYIVLKAVVPPSDSPGTSMYSTTSCAFSIDNVTLKPASPCPTPQNVRVTGTTATGADAVWDLDHHADSCLIYIGEPGFSIDTATPIYVYHISTASDTTGLLHATVGNLAPDTEYELVVTAVCNGTESYGAPPVPFRTLCAPLEVLPYFEDFEGVEGLTSIYYYGANVLPHCWRYYNEGIGYEGTGHPRVQNNPPYAHSGSNALRFNTRNSNVPPDYTVRDLSFTDQIAILPLTDAALYPVSSLQVTFGLHSGETNNSTQLVEVGVMSDPFDTSTFVTVATIMDYHYNTYRFYTVGFANYTGPHGHVALKAPIYTPTHAGGANQFYIDDVTLDVINGCPPIDAIHAEATSSAAWLTWEFNTDFGTPTGFEVSYRSVDDSTVTTVITSTPEYMLTGLAAESSYWVSVVAECAGSYGEADTLVFSTRGLPCVDWDTVDIAGDTLVLGNPGTGTTHMFPVNGAVASSRVQHLFLATEIPVSGPATLKGIGFDYAYNMPAVWAANCTIWLAHTTLDSMTNSFVGGEQLVYTGSLAFSEPGWNYVLFNEGLFEYDGESNLCVTIEKNWNNPANANYVFRYETTVDHDMTCWGCRNPRPVGAYLMGTVGNNMRSNTRLITGGDVYCGRLATCMPPVAYVDSSVAGQYRIWWIPGYQEESWNVDYRIADTGTWVNAITETAINEYTLTIANLQYDTRYEVRVTSVCSDTTVSDTVTFFSSCTYIDIPFHYDFDGLPTGSSTEPPDIHCWTHLNNGTIYNGSPYITTYAHSGNRGLSFFGSPRSGYGDYGIMVLPPVNTDVNPMNTLYVDFWAKTPSCKIYVGVMTDPTDVNTFTAVDTVVVEWDDNAWDLCEASLGSYNGDGQYIALRSNRGDGGGMIDDITVTNVPMCRRVHNIIARNVTTDSATLSWTRGDGEEEWELTVGEAVFHVTDTIYTVHNLEFDSPYNVTVRAVCGEGDTSVPTFTFFQTPCYLLDSLPYMNDFENEPYYSWTMGEGTNYYYAFPACWRRLHDYRTANNFNYHHPYVCSANNYLIHGSKSIYWERESNGNGPSKAYVVLPPVDLGVFRMDSLYLSFYAKNTNNVSGAPTQLIVGALANSSDTASFEPVDTVTLTNTATLYTVRFNNYTGTNNYIAICLPQYNNGRSVSIDDIYLTNHWCNAPADLVSTATSSELTLRWNRNGVGSFSIFLAADSVVYDSVNDETYTVTGATDTVTGVTDTVYTFHNLYDSTVYNYIVRTECFGHLGQYLTGSIQTECRPFGIQDLPYYENFEAYGNHYQSPISRCWHRGGSQLINGFYQPRLQNLTIGADTVGLCFSAYSPGYKFCWASLPRLEDSVDLSTLELSFLIIRPGSTSSSIPVSKLVVGVSTDIYAWYDGVSSTDSLSSDIFVPVDTIDISDLPVNSIQPASVFFHDYTGNGRYIVFLASSPEGAVSNSSYNSFYIDNVTLNIENPCHTPEHVTVTRVTWDSLYVTWDGDPNVGSYIVYIGAPGFDMGSVSPIYVSDNHIAIGNLNPDTDYELVLVANCVSGESQPSYPVSFHTLCSPIDNLPFTEDFESVAGIPSYTTYSPVNTLPACWMRYNGGNIVSYNSYPLVHNDSTIAHSGHNAVFFATANNSSSSTDLIAIMPVTDAALFPVSGLQVSFWMRCAHGYNSYIVVGVMSDPTDTSTFVAIDTIYTYSIELHNNTMLYRKHDVSLAGYNGPHGNVAFKAPGVVHTVIGVNSPYIDDITLDVRPCTPVQNLHVAHVTPDSLVVVWNDTGGDIGGVWYLEYDSVDFTPGTGTRTPIHMFDTLFIMTDLTPSTTYHIYLYPDCMDSADYHHLAVTTPEPPISCPPPQNVNGTVSADSLMLRWMPGGSESQWELSFRSTTVIVDSPAYTFTNLPLSNGYTVYLRAICGEDDTSTLVSASFMNNRYTVNAVADDPDFGSVTGGGLYYYGDIATLTAVPNTGYLFIQWSDSVTSNPRTLIVTGDTTLVALFQTEEGIDNPYLSTSQRIDIYPNPTSGKLTVASTEPLVSASLTDMMGRRLDVSLLLSGNGTYSIDLTDRPQAVYLITLTTADGTQHTFRLLKH